MQVWQLQEPFYNNSSLSELYIRNIYSVSAYNKMISINYGSSTSSRKPWRWVRLDLVLSMRDTYINSNLNPQRFTSTSRRTEHPPMEHLRNDLKDLRNQHKNSHKLCNEMGHPVVRLTKSQRKLKQQHDQNFLMQGKPL